MKVNEFFLCKTILPRTKGSGGFIEGRKRVILLSGKQALECLHKYADIEAILDKTNPLAIKGIFLYLGNILGLSLF